MIDWFTVAAQIINFLVLVFLLKKFLYGPIIRAMDSREQTIAGRLNEAAQKRDEAQREIERYRKKSVDFDAQRADMLTEAKTAAEQQKKELVARARREVETVKARWLESVGQEKAAFLENLRKTFAAELYAIAEKVCSDLADRSLEDHMIEVFLQKINGLDGKGLEAIRTKLKDAGEGITIATSFEVSDQQKRSLSETVQRLSGMDFQPAFVLSKDILCGIELRAKGYSLGWNVDAYLKSLEEEFNKVLE